MKKLVVTLLAFLTNGVVLALPIGNPSEASLFCHGMWCKSNSSELSSSWSDMWSLRFGFYGDYIFNRYMRVDDKNVSAGANRDIYRTELYTNAGYVAFNVCNRADFFGTVGTSHIHMLSNTKALGFTSSPNGTETMIEFLTDLSWSFGGRITLWQCRCFTLGVEGQYFRFNPKIDSLSFLDDPVTNNSTIHLDNQNKTRYEEWQVGFGISYYIATRCPTVGMIPYLGIKWSGSQLKTEVPPVRSIPGLEEIVVPDMKSQKAWGWAVGTTLSLCNMAGVTVEGRFVDECAVYVNGEIRF